MADTDNTFFLVDVSSSKNPNKFCKISPEDAALALRYKWSITRGKDKFGLQYVRAVDRSAKPLKYVKLHRLILDAPPGMHVDHINGDPLDNRRCNLRLATPQQNLANSRKHFARTSAFKGVSWHSEAGKWRAAIGVGNRKQRHLGMFENEGDAALAYDRAAKELWGEFAHVNFG